MRDSRKKVKPQPNSVLIALRNELGLTQGQFAALVGYVRIAYVAVERGRKRPSLGTFEAIWKTYRPELKRLGFDFEDLCQGRAA